MELACVNCLLTLLKLGLMGKLTLDESKKYEKSLQGVIDSFLCMVFDPGATRDISAPVLSVCVHGGFRVLVLLHLCLLPASPETGPSLFS